MLKIDKKTLGQYANQDNSQIDFVAAKVKQFMEIQDRLPSLDHNTMNSETDQNLKSKYDGLMMNIAL